MSEVRACNYLGVVPPEARKKVLAYAIAASVQKKLEKADINTLATVYVLLDRAVSQLQELKPVYDKVKAAYLAYAAAYSAYDTLSKLSSGEYDYKTLKQLLDGARSNIENLLKDDSVRKELRSETIADLIDLSSDLATASKIVEKLGSAQEVVDRFRSSFENLLKFIQSLSQEQLAKISNDPFDQVLQQYEAVRQQVAPLINDAMALAKQMRTKAGGAVAQYIENVAKNFTGIGDNIETMARLFRAQWRFSQNLQRFMDLVKDSRSFLEKRGELFVALSEALSWAGQVGLMASFRPELSQFRSLFDQYIATLSNLKLQLTISDPRYADLFEDAEMNTGVRLAKATPSEVVFKAWKDFFDSISSKIKGTQYEQDANLYLNYLQSGQNKEQALSAFERLLEGLLQKLEEYRKFVYDARDKAEAMMKSSDVNQRALGVVGMIGAGVLSAALIVNPVELKNTLQFFTDGFAFVLDRISKGDFPAIANAARELLHSMFGTREAMAFTIGNIIAVALATAGLGAGAAALASRAPVLARGLTALRIVLFQDIEPVIKFIRSSRVVSAFSLASEEVVSKYSETAGRADMGLKAVKTRLEEVIKTGGASEALSRYMRSLENQILSAAKRYRGAEEFIQDVRRVLESTAAEDLRVLVNELEKTANDILKAFRGEVSNAIMERVVVTPKQLDVTIRSPDLLTVKTELASLSTKVGDTAKAVLKAVRLAVVPEIKTPELPRVRPSATLGEAAARLEEVLKGVERLEQSIAKLKELGVKVPEKVEERLKEARGHVYSATTTKEFVERLERLLKATREAAVRFESERPFNEFKSRLADLLEGYGFKEEASAVRAASKLEELDGAVRKLVEKTIKSADVATFEVASRLLEAMRELSKNPALRELAASVTSKAEAVIRARLREVPIPRDVQLGIASRLRDVVEEHRELFPPEVRRRLLEAAARAERGELTLRELAELADLVAYPAQLGQVGAASLAAYIESPATRALINILSSYIDEAMAKMPELSELGEVRAGLRRLAEAKAPEAKPPEAAKAPEAKAPEAKPTEAKPVEVKPAQALPPEFRNAVEVVASSLDLIDKRLGERFRDVMARFEDAASKGSVTTDLAYEALKALREASSAFRRAGFISGGVKGLFNKLVNMFAEYKAKELEPLRSEAPRLLSEIASIPELQEGWRVANISGQVERAFIVRAPQAVLEAFNRVLSTPRATFEGEIKNIGRVRLTREVAFDKYSNSLTVKYTLELPDLGNRRITIVESHRSAGQVGPSGEVRVVRTAFVDYDPELRQMLESYASGKASKEAEAAAQAVGKLDEIIGSLDPEFNVLRNVVVEGAPLGSGIDAAVNAAKAGLKALAAAQALAESLKAGQTPSISPEVALALSLAADKAPVLQALSPGAVPVSAELERELRARGYVPVAVVNPAVYMANTVVPLLPNDIAQKVLSAVSDVAGKLGISVPQVSDVKQQLAAIISQLPEKTLIDIINTIRTMYPAVEEALRNVEAMLDKIIVVAVPSERALLPSLSNWVELRVGSVTVPVPILGRWQGKEVMIVPTPTIRIAKDIAPQVEQVLSQIQGGFMALGIRQLELTTPVQVQLQAQAPQLQTQATPPGAPVAVRFVSLVPAISNLPMGGAVFGGGAQRAGRQAELVNI